MKDKLANQLNGYYVSLITPYMEENNQQQPGTEQQPQQPAEQGPITAYDVKTKTKNVPILDAVITKTAKGAYMVKGRSAEGNSLTTLVNGAKAEAAIAAGHAKQGW